MEAPGLPLAVAGGRAPSASVDPGKLLRIQFELASTDQGPLCARPGAGPCPGCEWHMGPVLQMPPVWESLPLIPFRVCPEAAVPASCPGAAFAGFAEESRALAAGVGGPYGVNADTPPTPQCHGQGGFPSRGGTSSISREEQTKREGPLRMLWVEGVQMWASRPRGPPPCPDGRCAQISATTHVPSSGRGYRPFST